MNYLSGEDVEVLAERQRFKAALQEIADIYDARSEIFGSDAECARSLAVRAKRALGIAPAKEPKA